MEFTEEQYKSTAGQGFGIAALVVGIIALILAIIPCIGVIAIIPAIVGVVFGIIALMQANAGNGAKGIIIAALIVSSVAVVTSLLWTFYFTRAFNGDKIKRNFEFFDKKLQKLDEVTIDSTNSKLDKLEENMDKLQKDSTKKKDSTLKTS